MCKICNVEGCENKAIAKGMCSKHYDQMRKYGKTFKYCWADKKNHIEILEDHAEIFLINKKNEIVGKALIDLDDVDKVKDIKWHAENNRGKNFYVASNQKFKNNRLHRLIMDCPDGLIVDHINGNPLDNRKCNLRICTNQQNICNCDIPINNTSGCKGVYWSTTAKAWVAQVTINNNNKVVGKSLDYNEAVKIRIEAAKKYYGEFANDERCINKN